VNGVSFKKTFSYAGFEMQPKTYTNPKIALLNIELELKAERDNAEVRLDNVQVRRQNFILISFSC
jgi:T-complex protein 1 subunit eta